MKKVILFSFSFCAVIFFISVPFQKVLADFAIYFEKTGTGIPVVRIAATYYVKQGDADSKESAEYAVQFWNNQGGRFALSVGDKKNPTYYIVYFDLRVLETGDPVSEMKKDKAFAAGSKIKDGSSNCFIVVNDRDLPDYGETNGANFIKIRRSKKVDRQVAAHEVGHSLLMDDEAATSPSVMAEANTGADDVLSENVQQTLFMGLSCNCINKVTVHDKPGWLDYTSYAKVKKYQPGRMKEQKAFSEIVRLTNNSRPQSSQSEIP
jgi:hypothetical protein